MTYIIYYRSEQNHTTVDKFNSKKNHLQATKKCYREVREYKRGCEQQKQGFIETKEIGKHKYWQHNIKQPGHKVFKDQSCTLRTL